MRPILLWGLSLLFVSRLAWPLTLEVAGSPVYTQLKRGNLAQYSAYLGYAALGRLGFRFGPFGLLGYARYASSANLYSGSDEKLTDLGFGGQLEIRFLKRLWLKSPPWSE